MVIGNKPRYASSQPSTFMKGVEDELKDKRVKDAKDALERANANIEEVGDEE